MHRNKNPDLLKMLNCLWNHMTMERRRGFIALFFLMIIVSIVEVISIGSVIPFIGIISNPDLIFLNPHAQEVIKFLNITDSHQMILPILIFFCIATILAGFMRIWLLSFSNSLSFSTGSDLSLKIYQKTLYQPYIAHTTRNTSEIISGISSKTSNIIYGILLPALTLISSLVILLGIVSLLILVNPIISLSALFGFGLIYSVLAFVTGKEKRSNSKIVASQSTLVIKSLQEGLGGIRDVLLDGTQSIYCDIYYRAEKKLRIAQYKNQIMNQTPRYYIEMLGMLLIAVVAYVLIDRPQEYATPIFILGVLGLAAQRMLPIIQQSYLSLSLLESNHATLHDILELLNQPMPDYFYGNKYASIEFKDVISLNNVNFRYSNESPDVLSGINIKIKKGDCIGFIGPTGCGKSTLLDLIMGLLEPTSGSLKVDEVAILSSNQNLWYPKIAHVPQSIFLTDGTVLENIAFGVPKHLVDEDLVKRCADVAQLSETVESWIMGYQTLVGERGIRLSGGQRQRIGIARALYKRADIMIMDEATSALDSQTERRIMDAIHQMSSRLTILMVAHRISTLSNCNKIIKMKSGCVDQICNYSDII
jgi:ABC-type multidrug transport system fused ATPase/permease subunit